MPPSVPTRKREVFEYDTGTVLYSVVFLPREISDVVVATGHPIPS